MKPLRILMLLENNPYPQDTRVHHEADSLSQAGHMVSVICPRDEKTGDWNTRSPFEDERKKSKCKY